MSKIKFKTTFRKTFISGKRLEQIRENKRLAHLARQKAYGRKRALLEPQRVFVEQNSVENVIIKSNFYDYQMDELNVNNLISDYDNDYDEYNDYAEYDNNFSSFEKITRKTRRGE